MGQLNGNENTKEPNVIINKYLNLKGLSSFWGGVKQYIADQTPTHLPNPKDLTIQGNGTLLETYNGSEAKTINITPTSIGALSLGGGTMDGIINSKNIIPTASNTYNLGNASYKWKGVYATNFIENGANINTIYADKSYADYCSSYLHSANRAQFCKPDGVTLEYSTDGGLTWVDYGATYEQKIGLFSGISQSFKLGKALSTKALAADMLRLTMDATAMGFYTSCKSLLLNISTNGSSNFRVKVEKSMKGSEDDFSTHIESQTLTGWSGWNRIPIGNSFGGSNTQTWNIAKLRLTFMSDGADSSYTSGAHASILDMEVLGTTYWTVPHTMAKTGHIYSWDALGNATFGKNVTASALYITGSKNNTTAHISSDAAYNMYFSSNNVIPLVINTSTANPVIRAALGLNEQVDLGSQTVKWRNIYSKTLYEDGISLVNKYAAKDHTHSYLTGTGEQNSALSRNLTDFPKEKTLFTGGWNTSTGGYATNWGTTLDISYSTYYQRLAFNTTGRIEYFRGINTNNANGTEATLSKIGDLAYTSESFIINRDQTDNLISSEITSYADLSTATSGQAAFKLLNSGSYKIARSGSSELLINLGVNTGSASALEFLTGHQHTGRLKVRKVIDSNRVSGKFKELAWYSDIPTSLKNPYKLSITVGTNTAVEYDGSSTKSVTITPASIGAVSSSHTHAVTYTPSGTVISTLNDASVSIDASSGTTTVKSVKSVGSVPTRTEKTMPKSIHTHAVTYTPSGTVTSTFSEGSVSVNASSGTTTVASQEHTHTANQNLPGASYSNGILTIVTQHTHTVPKTSTTGTTVASSGHTHTGTIAGEVTSTFSGTEATVTASATSDAECETIYSITGVGSVPTTEDVTVASSGHIHTGTITGTVTSTFTGTEDTVTSGSAS